MPRDIIELEKTLRRYLESIVLTLRPNTVAGYRCRIGLFIGYLRREHPEISCFSQLKRPHVEAWLRCLARSALRRSGRRNKILTVRAFVERIQAGTGRKRQRRLFSLPEIYLLQIDICRGLFPKRPTEL